MLIMDFFHWWYNKGLKQFLNRFKLGLSKILDFFSVGILIRTLFHPFRLIDSQGYGRDLGSRVKSFIDRTISRLIGAIIRLITLLSGLVVIALSSVSFVLSVLIWLIMPLLPFGLVILFIFEAKI